MQEFEEGRLVRLLRIHWSAGAYRLFIGRILRVLEYEMSPEGRHVYTLEPVTRLSVADNETLGRAAGRLLLRVQGNQLEGIDAVYVDLSAPTREW